MVIVIDINGKVLFFRCFIIWVWRVVIEGKKEYFFDGDFYVGKLVI